MLYLIPFLVGLMLSAVLTGVVVWVSRWVRLGRRKKESGRGEVGVRGEKAGNSGEIEMGDADVDVGVGNSKDAKKGKLTNIPRIGGAVMILAFVGALVLDANLVLDRQWLVLLLAVCVIGLAGLIDDLWILTWRSQLFVQVAVAVVLFALGVQIEVLTNPLGGVIDLTSADGFAWLSLLVSVGWILVVVNALNWIDGVDGLGGGITLVAGGAIFAVALLPEVNQPPVAIVAVAFMGSVLGFLLYNWQPARIVAGTSGSLFWGLMIAVLAMFAGAKVATALLVMVIPLVDAVWVIASRVFAGTPIFAPDRRHLHHKLLARGWSHAQIALTFTLTTAIVAIASVYMTAWGKLIIIIAVALAVTGLLFVLAKNAQSDKVKELNIKK